MTIEGTVRSIDLSHHSRGGLGYTWATMTLQDIDKEHCDQFVGYPHFEWMNSSLDTQASGVKSGDRIQVTLNALSIPTKIERL